MMYLSSQVILSGIIGLTTWKRPMILLVCTDCTTLLFIKPEARLSKLEILKCPCSLKNNLTVDTLEVNALIIMVMKDDNLDGLWFALSSVYV